MIKKWLSEVQGGADRNHEVKDGAARYRSIQHEDNEIYVDEDEAKDLNKEEFDIELIAANKMKNIQSGDHFFMRTAKEGTKDTVVLEPSGDHIYNIKDNDGTMTRVPFLLDYTLRWNSRIENSRGAVGDKVPLIFASYGFFMSNRMLYFTIGLLLYTILGQIIASMYFGALSTDIYQTVGVLCGVCLGSYVVKGSFGAAVTKKVATISGRHTKSPTGTGTDGSTDSVTDTRKETEENRIPVEGSTNPMTDTVKVSRVSVPTVQKSPESTSFFSALMSDAKSLRTVRQESITGRKVKANGLVEADGFMDVLQLVTEYLTAMSTASNGFNARVYSTNFLWCGICVVSVYMSYWIVNKWVALNGCHYHRHYGYHSSSQQCNNLNFEAVFFLGYIVRLMSILLGILNLMVSLAILMYSADVANALTKYWLHRFRHLRRIAGPPSPDSPDAPVVPGDLALVNLQLLIERDAYERYLFTNTYFKEASSQWSFFLTVCLVGSFGLFLSAYFTILYIYALEQRIDNTNVILCTINATIFSFVFACMAYANGAVENIREGFLYAGAKDYALMGSRTDWLDYVDKAPIYWYIFGFAIKKSDIAAYVGGIVSAVAGGLVMSFTVSES